MNEEINIKYSFNNNKIYIDSANKNKNQKIQLNSKVELDPFFFNATVKIDQKNVNVYEIENNEDNLIKFYDDHNIFILPSFTEGHPMALLESLARLRPVIIFKEIEHVLGNKKGVFVTNRDSKSLSEKIKYIQNNYENIQRDMKKNELPLKENFLKQIEQSILKFN